MEKNTNKYLCVHGHFYQPPRENPWTDTIQIQKSASPYHDWNERITRECYGPNARSRLNGENGYIRKLVNNYEFMSFNFGPTLLRWMEACHPWVHSMILEGDRKSMDRFGGHGNAIAQVYNHIIMPLASERDKITQVKWGIADFKYRFNRKPEGMWLAETAVDNETLAVLAKEGIRYTILSPYQADSIKVMHSSKGNSEGWTDVSGGHIDCTRPYRCFPEKEKSTFIDLFFYNGPISRAIAYEKLLGSGESFLSKIKSSYPEDSNTPSLLSMATDGESYGHHFKFGEMALTWVLDTINNSDDIKLTNYGQFLELYPADTEVKIVEKSAWSCAHGVERWRSNCGCSVSQNPEWTQEWRTPLRDGLNNLNNQLSSLFEENSKGILTDCWNTRNHYIGALLSPDTFDQDAFIKDHCSKDLNKYERRSVFKLLKSQQMALFMFTSCGWFFDDIAGLEVIQILMYAKRAIELCREFSKTDMENDLLSFLEKAVCNAPEYENGKEVYISEVNPLQIDSKALTANYGMLKVVGNEVRAEWLENIVVPQNVKILDFNDFHVFTVASGNTELSDKGSVIACTAVRSQGSEIISVSGIINKAKLQAMEIGLINNTKLECNIDDLINIVKSFYDDCDMFSLENLIPDTKECIEKMLSEQLRESLYRSVLDNPDKIINYTKTLSITHKNPPEELVPLLSVFICETCINMFKNSNNAPIDFSSIESFLETFTWKPGKDDKIKTPFNPDILLQQKCIKLLLEDFLTEQAAKTNTINLNINLNNIINTIDFINKFKLNIDWWKIQNNFNEYRADPILLEKLNMDTLTLFKQAESLLGFTGGI